MEIKELIIDSTFRDRTMNPNPLDFIVQVNRPSKLTFSDSTDPICESAPLKSWTGNTLNATLPNVTVANGTVISSVDKTIEVEFSIPMFTKKDYYVGCFVQPTYKVTEYTFLCINVNYIVRFSLSQNPFVVGNVVTLQHPLYNVPFNAGNVVDIFTPATLTGLNPKLIYNETLKDSCEIIKSVENFATIRLTTNSWQPGDVYSLRNGLPLGFATITAFTFNTITVSTVIVVPEILYIPALNYFARVVSVVGNVLTITPNTPVGMLIGMEIQYLQFDYDNVQNVQYNGTRDQQERTWIVMLKSVMIPRILQIDSYSHLFLEFRNPSSNQQNIMSNNPFINSSSFRLIVDKKFTNDNFYTFFSEKTEKTIRFSPTSNFFNVKITTPDGKCLFLQDTQWPLPPLSNVQINISLMLKMQK